MAGSHGACAILLLVLHTSALEWRSPDSPDPFRFVKDIGVVYRRSDDRCKICLRADSCVDIETDKCNYYMETAKIIRDDSLESPQTAVVSSGVEGNSRLRADVDAMLYSLADSVYQQHQYEDCIPLVSKYTNCHKENICLGCKTCECDATGHWNCTFSSQCRPQPLRVTLDHRSLLIVLDNLRKEDINTNRVKRHTEDVSKEKKMKYEYLSEWMYGVPLVNETTVDKYKNFDDDDGITESNDAKYTYSSKEIPGPIYADKYSDTKIVESNEQKITPKNEKPMKFILHDPLYEFTGPNSVFEGNSNKIKRSVEYEDGDLDDTVKKLINSTNVAADNIDVEEWLRESKLILNEFNNWRHKHEGIYVLNSTKKPDETLEIIANLSNYLREKMKTTENYMDASETHVNDKTTPTYDMSEINEFVSKVFGNENTNNNNNLTTLIADDNEIALVSEVIEKNKIMTANDDVNKEINPGIYVTAVNTPYNAQNYNIKRSVDNLSEITNKVTTEENNNFVRETSNENLRQINKDDINEWLNDQHPFNQTQKSATDHVTETSTRKISTSLIDKSTIFSTTDYMTVLKDVDEDILDHNRTYSRRKPPLISNDYMYDEDAVSYEDEILEDGVYFSTDFQEDTSHTSNIMSTTETSEFLTTTEAVEAAVTEVVIDLLESAKSKLKTKINTKDNIKPLNNILGPIQNSNTIDGESSNLPANLMKRDVSYVLQDNIETTVDNVVLPTLKQTPNISATVKDLIHDVLLPLNNILYDRQKELDELIKMKDGLVKFIKSGKNYDSALSLNLTDIKNNTSHNRNSYFSVYKLEMVPNFELDFKKTNASILERFMSKLKHDVYEVIKDVVGIQKLHSDASKVPGDIKFLINAMKQYIHKKGFHLKSRDKNETSLRRQLDNVQNDLDSSSIKDRIIKIIELLDKDIHKDNLLNSLSPAARKIVKRLIKSYYTDEFAIVGLRVHDPHYNLTDDLNNVGLTWDVIAKGIHTGTSTSQLYKMKSLYRVVNVDISKMVDALSLIDFARTRRMMPIDQNVGEDIIKRITDDLYLVHQQIIRTDRFDREMKRRVQNSPLLMAQPKQKIKKDSFIKQLKKILINSKRDIMSLLHHKVPKSDIVKELARERLDTVTRERLSEYEDTMQRWQKQLKVTPYREKRAAKSNAEVKRRMNNILPKYLQGKVPNGVANVAKPLRDRVRKALKPVRDSKVMAKVREIAPKTKSKKVAKKKPQLKSGKSRKSTAVKITPHKIDVVDRKNGVKTQNHKTLPKQTKKTKGRSSNKKKVIKKTRKRGLSIEVKAKKHR